MRMDFEIPRIFWGNF